MRTCRSWESAVMPRNIVIETAPMTASVVAAFFA
jgi:hypothetical protein